MVQVGFVTITVSDLKSSRVFYEDVLGLKPDIWYEPCQWLSFSCGGSAVFAIMEVPGFARQQSEDMTDFYMEGIDGLWDRIKDRVNAVHGPRRTPWGSYKFIVRDPDGYQIAIVEKP